MPYATREARRAYERAYHRSTSERRVKRLMDQGGQRLLAIAIIRSAKAQPCADCGRTFPHYMMEFDHVPGRGKKRAPAATLVRSGLGVLRREIAKCQVVCSNHHSERTWLRSRKD